MTEYRHSKSSIIQASPGSKPRGIAPNSANGRERPHGHTTHLPPNRFPGRPAPQQQEWRDDDWAHEDSVRSNEARRLLSRRRSLGVGGVFHKLIDVMNFRGLSRLFRGHRWVAQAGLALLVVVSLATCAFGALWWRLGQGPIGFDMATPWLASAIKDNVGNDYSVEIGGTQIERAGRARIAVRVLDIVVRDRDAAVVASAPKAEVRISGLGLLIGRLRAESISFVDAELAVRVEPDGRISVSTGTNAKPIVTAVPPVAGSAATAPGASQAAPVVAASPSASSMEGILAALAWLDGLSASGLDGHDLDEVGLKNGRVVIDDQQSGNHWTFENISLSLRRPSGGGVQFSVGEEGPVRPWSFQAAVGPQVNGVRSIELIADKMLIKDMLFALRLKDASYTADIPLTGRIRGEIGRDGLPTFVTGKVRADAGSIVDRRAPEYLMTIDQADVSVDWDSTRRVLVAPFQVLSGPNRITLLAHLEPPSDSVPTWQLGLSGGTIVLPGQVGEPPLIFNRIAIRMRFDTVGQRIVLTQGDISNGTVGVAGTGTFDFSTPEPRLTAGIAGTPMTASELKRMWPVVINPEVREWILARVEAGSLQRAEIAINAPTATLARGGPPIPDDGLSINFIANNVRIRPVDDVPSVHDAGVRVRITGRTANVNIAQAQMDTPDGRKLSISDFNFDIADMAPKPMQTRVRFRVDSPVATVAEILSSPRWREFAGDNLIDPATSKGNLSGQVSLAMPLKEQLSKEDTAYAITADVSNFAADKLVMNQRVEANLMKIIANNQGYQVRGDVKINGQTASLDYRKPSGDGDAEVKLAATLDDAGRTRLGIDLGQGVSGAIPLKLNGRIGSGDRDSKFGIEADLNALRIDNILPGWVKSPGRAGKATFNVIKKEQTTRFEDILVDGGGASIKGAVEIDDKGDLVSAVFPTYQASEGDKASLRAERMQDGTLKIVVRGDVFDGRSFIKSAVASTNSDKKQKINDFDLDLKLGVIAGHNGETMRGVDVKLVRRGGTIRTFSLHGKLGRDTAVLGDLRGRTAGRTVMYVETADAGALFRFADAYSKIYGGKVWIAMDPPTANDKDSQEGLINVSNFSVRGETKLQQAAQQAGGANAQNSLQFTRLRAEFTKRTGQLSIRDGIVAGPTMGATIEGDLNYNSNQVAMSGTFLPVYGLNNIFGQIPILGLFMGGSNEGLIGITYRVTGTTGDPRVDVNPLSAVAPGVLRKIFDFGTGRQNQTPLDSFGQNQN